MYNVLGRRANEIRAFLNIFTTYRRCVYVSATERVRAGPLFEPIGNMIHRIGLSPRMVCRAFWDLLRFWG